MFSHHALKKRVRPTSLSLFRGQLLRRRCLHYDGRNRLSNFWTPTQWSHDIGAGAQNGHDLLVRAGFLRQAYSGIFHLLPLGLRVQNKIERLIDKHMQNLGAAKVSLSSLSSEDLWQRSGRLDKGRTSELLRFEDRKGSKYLLSPTHEEEITTIVANAIKSYKDLPLRLYQVSRKYRDEPRPRQGLLRGREFIMKDLYTFDATAEAAHQTYDQVRRAYVAFLEDLRLPYLTARASSGNMGGDLSHEYHFASPYGEDTIITCNSCEYSLNEELYVGNLNNKDVSEQPNASASPQVSTRRYISKDRTKTCRIFYCPDHGEPNIYAVKALFPEVDTGVEGDWKGDAVKDRVFYRDPRLSSDAITVQYPAYAKHPPQISLVDGRDITLTKAREGKACPNCDNGKLKLHQAVEIGHTFHLGKRYSIPLEAKVANENNEQVAIEMGCHGIGVSRLIGAVASLLMDSKGLNWPMAISPFDVIMIPRQKWEFSDLEAVYDSLTASNKALDVVIDDRQRDMIWKMNDADLVGYPFIAVFGKGWYRREVELQCRRLGVKKSVPVDELEKQIREYSKQL